MVTKLSAADSERPKACRISRCWYKNHPRSAGYFAAVRSQQFQKWRVHAGRWSGCRVVWQHVMFQWPTRDMVVLWARSVAYFVGAPFWLVKTRLQAAEQFIAEERQTRQNALAEVYPDARRGRKIGNTTVGTELFYCDGFN